MKTSVSTVSSTSQQLPAVDSPDIEDGASDGGQASDDATSADGADGNRGWADVMSRLLTAPAPKKRYVILAKAKKAQPDEEPADDTKKVTKSADFEIEGEEKPTESASKPEVSVALSKAIKRKEEVEKRRKLRAWETMGRLKPDILDKERERTLCKIATRGVVQLFNAVRKHQLETNAKLKDAGGSIRKQEHALKEVTKEAFMERLKNGGAQQRGDDEQELGGGAKRRRRDSEDEPDGATWSVLREDYMPEAGLRDWDCDSDSDQPGPEDADSDDST